MGLPKKDKKLVLKRREYEIFCLIKAGMLGVCTHLMSKEECEQISRLSSKNSYPYALSYLLSKEDAKHINAKDEIALYCEDKCVGTLFVEDKFKEKSNIMSIFLPNSCLLPNENIFLGGEFELFDSHIEKTKQEFFKLKTALNAKKITALVSSFDPLHRGHERILRLSIDKSDLVVIFLIESYEDKGFDFELKRTYTKKFLQDYIPKDRVFIFELPNIDLFHAHLNPTIEATIASSLGCTKLVVGQNHSGLGMFYDSNRPYTILDDFAKKYKLEVVVLPEVVFCEKCRALVSIKSCQHGTHHHIKFNTKSLKTLLRLGIMPPPIFMRRELSTMILCKLFPQRFKDMQNLYNDLFANDGIIKERSDEEFYYQLLKLYQITYTV